MTSLVSRAHNNELLIIFYCNTTSRVHIECMYSLAEKNCSADCLEVITKNNKSNNEGIRTTS